MHLQVNDWYRLGLALNLDSYDLDIIRKDNQGDAKAQTLIMFQLWLTRQPQASYKQLIQALHEVGDERVVTFLCGNYGEYVSMVYICQSNKKYHDNCNTCCV